MKMLLFLRNYRTYKFQVLCYKQVRSGLFWPFLSSWCSFPFSKQSPTMDLLWSFPPQTTTHSATVLWSHNGQNGLDQGQPNSHLKKAIFGEWVFVASSGWWWGNSIFRIIRQMQRPTLIRSIWPFLASVLNFWRMRRIIQVGNTAFGYWQNYYSIE